MQRTTSPAMSDSRLRVLRSFVAGHWHEADTGLVPIVNPATEEPIGRVSAAGIDTAEVIEFAHRGGVALRALSFNERGSMLREISRTLRGHRDELLELSRLNNGTTESDGSFDIDGASGALAFYAGLASSLGDRRFLVHGDSVPMSKSGELSGRHLWVPRRGVAVHINAFNFPAWGMGEKLACALVAGMPVVTKPASATAMVAERWAEIVIESGLLPPGSLQVICGSTGDLLDRLGPQDVLAFTGSAATGAALQGSLVSRRVTARFNRRAVSARCRAGNDPEGGAEVHRRATDSGAGGADRCSA
jgi:3,4-dehydroadipyl-CoA semialdehyde dehydrogenase